MTASLKASADGLSASLQVGGVDQATFSNDGKITAAKGLVGAPIQAVHSQTGALATGTTTFPIDNTIPQNTEGDQYMSATITPKAASNKLLIEVTLFASHSAGGAIGILAALFQDANTNALAVGYFNTVGANSICNISFKHEMAAGTTSATTFKVRLGGAVAGTLTFNGSAGTAYFGGSFASSIRITEFAQ